MPNVPFLLDAYSYICDGLTVKSLRGVPHPPGNTSVVCLIPTPVVITGNGIRCTTLVLALIISIP